MWILRNIPLMAVEIHLRQYCDRHVTSLWKLTDRNQIHIVCNESVWSATCEFKPWIMNQRIMQLLQCCLHWERTFLIFAQNPSLSVSFLNPMKDKKWNILNKNYFIHIFDFPYNYRQLNMKEISLYYNCSLLLVIWTVCQCSLCTHILNTGRIYWISSVLSF